MNMFLAEIPPKLPQIAFTIGDLTVRWYAIILTSAMIIALLVLYYMAKGKNFTGDFVLEVFLWTIPLSIIFARLGFCLPRIEYWTSWEGFCRVFKIWEGGLTILAGIFGGLLGIWIACKHKKVALFDIVDLVIPALLIGQSLGRWGNFMNEELYGVAITNPNLQWFPFAVYIHDYIEPGWHAANFFYESVMNFFMAIFVICLIKRGKNKPGEISAIYLFWYGLLRGLLEFIKVGAFQLGGVVGGAQIFSFCMSAFGLIWFLLIRYNKIKYKTTAELRIKKHIQYVSNDAFIEGTFNEEYEEAEQRELEEERERRDFSNRKKSIYVKQKNKEHQNKNIDDKNVK